MRSTEIQGRNKPCFLYPMMLVRICYTLSIKVKYKGSPNFLSVSLPRLGIYVGKDDSKTKYTIDIWDGNQFTFYAEALPGEEVVFPQGGVYEFRVTGIDPEFKICP